jgi:succinate dehydrogenase/fumarate reductase cytochrome b subunit (b558 family)
MTAAATELTSDAESTRRAFVLRRLHSLTGVVPIGAFLVEHLWTNAAALGGEAAFDRAVAQIQALPALPLLEVLGILLPLAFHGGLGVVYALRGRPNAVRYAYARNWLYVLQRVSGVIALAFVAYHLWELRVQKAFFGMRDEQFYTVLQANLSATHLGVPWVALFYLVGLGSTVFHFANGLYTFSLTWGLVASRRGQRRVGWVAGGVGVALFALGLETVLFLATGSRLLAPEPQGTYAPIGTVPCNK